MKQQALIEALKECRSALEAEGATSLYLFGSRARGDHRPDSDVDVFVEYDEHKKFSLFNLAGIKLAIEDRVGVSAHVATREQLYAPLRAEIERQAIRVF
jgi:uncharacterized protein